MEKGEIEERDKVLRKLLEIHGSKDLVPFVGAGFSSPLCPGWEIFLEKFFNSIKTNVMNEREIADYENAKRANSIYRLENMAEILIRSGRRGKFERVLKNEFDKELLDKMRPKFMKLHQAFPGLKVTTNFDCLIERNPVTYSPEVIRWNSARDLAGIFTKKDKSLLVKIHGCLEDSENIILTKKQYQIHYGPKRSYDPEAPLPKFLKELFVHRSIIFIGCSLNTDRILTVLNKIEEVAPHFAIMRLPMGNKNEKIDIEKRLSQLRVTPIWIREYHEIDSILEKLSELTQKNKKVVRRIKIVGFDKPNNRSHTLCEDSHEFEKNRYSNLFKNFSPQPQKFGKNLKLKNFHDINATEFCHSEEICLGRSVFPGQNSNLALNSSIKSLAEKLFLNQEYASANQNLVLSRYLLMFDQLSYFELIRSINNIEENIFLDTIRRVDWFLHQNGFIKEKNRFVKNNELIKYTHSSMSILGGIKLCIIIERVAGPNKLANPIKLPINEIGRIQEIEVIAPESLSLHVAHMALELGLFLKSVYYALEEVFKRKAIRTNHEVFGQLYNAIRVQLTAKNRTEIFGRFWLILGTFGKYDLVVYFFDDHSFMETVTHFKDVEQNGVADLSPLDMLITLLTDTFQLSKSLAIEAWRAEKPLSLPWANAKYMDDSPKIFSAEVRLYDSKDYSGYIIGKTRDYFLILGCPTEFEETLISEIKIIEQYLRKTFSDNLARWSAYINTLSVEIWKKEIVNVDSEIG